MLAVCLDVIIIVSFAVVLIGATEERLRFEAHRSEFDLELDSMRALDVGLGMNIRLAQVRHIMHAFISSPAFTAR